MNDTLFIAQRVNYYPFGSPHRSDSLGFAFTYQNKEYINFFGYDMYNFGWRQGDSWTGRWTSTDPANQFLSMTPYNFMGGNPVSYIDPDGRALPILIFVGAAVIGGGGNLWSNWSKVKDWKSGLAYFASGAVGGAVSVVNPGAGAGITIWGNVATDVATSNMPTFNNAWDVAKYTGGLALDGLGVAGAGSLARTGIPKLASWFSPSATVSMGGRSGATIVNYLDEGFESVANFEVIVKPAIKGFGQNTLAKSVRQGLNFVDDAGKGTYSVYQGFDSANKLKYVGITSRDAAIRFGEHYQAIGTGKELLDYRVIKGAENLTKSQARIWEQNIINQYGLAGQEGGKLLNKINSIAPKNWMKFGIR